MLKSAGYRSYHSGKWHVDGGPVAGGFDHSYWLDDQDRYFSPKKHYDDDEPLPAVKRDAGYYATTAIADHAIAQSEGARGEARRAAVLRVPRVHGAAFSASRAAGGHRPLSRRAIEPAGKPCARRAGTKSKHSSIGADSLSAVELDIGPRNDRTDALEKVGPGEINRPLPVGRTDRRAARVPGDEDGDSRRDGRSHGPRNRPRARAAASDGRLGQHAHPVSLRQRRECRDHGPRRRPRPRSAARLGRTAFSASAPAGRPWATRRSAVTRPGSSKAASRRRSSSTGRRASRRRAKLRHNAGHVIDIVPTILDLADVKKPSYPNAPTPPGKSLIPSFIADNSVSHDYLWWFHQGSRALRVGDWKIVADEGEPWELYDLQQRSRGVEESGEESARQSLQELAKIVGREARRVSRGCNAQVTKRLIALLQPPAQPGYSSHRSNPC